MKSIWIGDLKKDDIFYECEYGEIDKYIALEDAHQGEDDLSDGIVCRGKNVESGDEIDFFCDSQVTCYGPHLYAEK